MPRRNDLLSCLKELPDERGNSCNPAFGLELELRDFKLLHDENQLRLDRVGLLEVIMELLFAYWLATIVVVDL